MKRRASVLIRVLSLAAAVLWLPAGPAITQEAQVQAQVRLTHVQATVGERVGFEIIVRTPAGSTVILPDMPLRVGDLDLLERQPAESLPDGTEHRYRYVLAPFYVGELFVPPVQVRVRTVDGREMPVQTEALSLRVTAVIPDGDPADNVHDLLPQTILSEEPYRFPWELGTGVAGLVAALLALALIVRKLLRAVRPMPAPPVYISPEDAARAALDQLAAGGVPTRRVLKQHYTALSAVVRRYLSERFAFPAVALTTTEMDARMAAVGLDRWQARLVSGLLLECDSVRYAQYVPVQQRARDDLALAYEIIEVGRSRPLAEVGAAAVADAAAETGDVGDEETGRA